jgi:hypothetical protein
MATTLPVDKYVGRLPVNYTQPRPNQFFRDVINRLRLRVTDDNVILGYTDVTHATTPPPGFNMGPFYGRPLFDSAKWQFWSDPIGRYTWELHQVRDTSGFTVTLAAPGLTLPFYEQNLEDASGDVAMLTDIYVPRETIFFDSTSGAVTIDATTSYDFYGKLNANTAFTVSMPGNSMHVTVGVANIGTQFTATWTPAIKWEDSYLHLPEDNRDHLRLDGGPNTGRSSAEGSTRWQSSQQLRRDWEHQLPRDQSVQIPPLKWPLSS